MSRKTRYVFDVESHLAAQEKREFVLDMFISARNKAIRSWKQNLITATEPVDIAAYEECIKNYENYNRANEAEKWALTHGAHI